MASFIDMSRVPFIPGRLHATNSPYQRYGPKGFMEIKVLGNDSLYVRVDLPGVPDDAIRYRVDAVRQKLVFFSGEETLRDGVKAEDVREYSGSAGLGCDCCEITGVDAKMKDGVLRMIVSRVKVKDHDNKCTHFVPPNAGKSGRYGYQRSSDERYLYDQGRSHMVSRGGGCPG
ncbi:putative 57 kDa heat shock protein [Raphanus sativus]|uniref:57 kDa heat shock protein n=1 Tax=Raphanus sativus TaxID=3726 RepID=A0A9W3BZQ8_RAPSA|nr:putative 57 kDa heat shock protein [Raphanus sativus]